MEPGPAGDNPEGPGPFLVSGRARESVWEGAEGRGTVKQGGTPSCFAWGGSLGLAGLLVDGRERGEGMGEREADKDGQAAKAGKAREVGAKPQMSEAEREALIKEAHDQTAAILRLEVYKRLGYSAVAVGVLLGYWNMWGGGPGWAMPLGIVLLVLGALASFILYTGISNAKRNVRAILTAAGVDPNLPKQEKRGKGKGSKEESDKEASAKDEK